MTSGKDPQAPWLEAAQQFQQNLIAQWTQAAQAFPGAAAAPGPSASADPFAAFKAFMPQGTAAQPFGMPGGAAGFPGFSNLFDQAAGQKVKLDPAQMLKIQTTYVQEMAGLWNQGAHMAPVADRRFSNDAWASNPVAAFTAATYLLNARTLMAMADAVEGDAKTKTRVRFAVQQWIDASAPSNFLAFNAEAQKKAIDTQGESIAKGVANLLHDLKQGHVSMTDESVFEVGKNVATTEGAVVFENELFQLIEYKPLTAKVYERPFLLVPPCINKFYILDLQPKNSLIRYCVEQGHRTFVVSWRNPDESIAHKTWDNYIEDAVMKAISVTQDITGADSINALGFCVGGTMLSNALAVLAARGEEPVNSATFLTTLIDFTDTGILDLFIDESFVKYREMQFAEGGLMPGRDLATTFSFLRPNDLVWNYVVGNYLKGESPPPFDLLYWNSDATNLPGPYYAWYLRQTYLENNLVQPGKTVVCGEKIDFRKVKLPVYVYGSREDHIVPIGGAYASTQVFPGKKRFVMGASGHIAGVINPPAAGKRSHWIGAAGKFPTDVNEWIDSATEQPGSWWTDWSDWLKPLSGKQIAAPKAFGKGKSYPAIEPAPGRYVKAKA
ncbi:class I poly(R)-hydroxyalkanoic acid synthase [Hydrogenophaga sp. PAMC20947]|uniref:PHA/PHB synthase family protein n=1 Tax=Hydrogenophaga sp. PAMC20947 TaxID=2565558 RepID=UPI00109DC0E1|nr:class I poly(R)-hydroxyalkanoic acid synthase [Hydrogenophaga sp. PAMC20947]QCB45741.1 class I poly(R)-hydroxyalkanoic acid synthase [Hydrogenophaga sp. PAMC20947]